jgi:hypothetical protein
MVKPGSFTTTYTGTNGTSLTIKYDGSSGGNGYNILTTTPTLLSGYITKADTILSQLITNKDNPSAKVTALERLKVLQQTMQLAKQQGLF